MDELANSFPQGVNYLIPYDTTKFVRAAIREVYLTLIEAAVLVLIVILVFLQDWRAMLVPATTVPVTIIGAFAAMAALGFAVNLATLFAIVLAIGIVVDDAIVIVEGVSRYVEEGLPGREAAGKAMDDLIGPVIGITLVRVYSSGLHTWTDRTALSAVRARHRRHSLHQRDQRRNLEAHAKRAVAATAAPARAAQPILSRLQRRFRSCRTGLCRTRQRDDAPQRPHGSPCSSSRHRCVLGPGARADRIFAG
jgi:hypothetical protein